MSPDDVALPPIAPQTLSPPASLLISALNAGALASLGAFLLRETTGPIVAAGLCLLAAICVGIGEELMKAGHRDGVDTLETGAPSHAAMRTEASGFAKTRPDRPATD